MNGIFHLSKLSAFLHNFHVEQSEKQICFGALCEIVETCNAGKNTLQGSVVRLTRRKWTYFSILTKNIRMKSQTTTEPLLHCKIPLQGIILLSVLKFQFLVNTSTYILAQLKFCYQTTTFFNDNARSISMNWIFNCHATVPHNLEVMVQSQ